MQSQYSFEYFENEVKKKRKKIIELEEKLAELKDEYKKLIFKKAGWEFNLYMMLSESQKIDIK